MDSPKVTASSEVDFFTSICVTPKPRSAWWRIKSSTSLQAQGSSSRLLSKQCNTRLPAPRRPRVSRLPVGEDHSFVLRLGRTDFLQKAVTSRAGIYARQLLTNAVTVRADFISDYATGT
jgi:hypothetical protein